MDATTWRTKIGGKELIVESGKLATLASGSATVRYGETVLLATAVYTNEAREGIDFFPLMVEYEERLYAAGKISGSRFMKREGRPSEEAILTARLIDRPIRPLFPKYLRNDLQVIITVLSYDPDHDPDTTAIIAASTAVTMTSAPFAGPVAAVRVGLVPTALAGSEAIEVHDGRAFVANPTVAQRAESTLDLVVAGTSHKVNMLEAGAKEVPEEIILQAIEFGHGALQPAIKLQEEIRAHIGELPATETPTEEVIDKVRAHVGDKVATALEEMDRERREAMLDEFEAAVLTEFEGDYKQVDIKSAFSKLVEKEVRRLILEKGIRPDGRQITEIRPLSSEVGLLPRVHGSGLFTRGSTQALTIATLGSPGEEQLIDTMEVEGAKRYMHHYNFPPFSTGEAKPLRGASRREIGHGALAERALEPVIPSKDEFPYTIRLVSEILSSNGSSSMAATCGSTLALMDAGVPIKRPVTGIAMGLVTDGQEGETGGFKVLTDLQGLEDFAGDMDFKITGTTEGVTAIQLDIKIKGLTKEIIRTAVMQARDARLEVLDHILKTIAKPRADLSPLAPRIVTLKIDPKRIGELIGPGGKTINGIIETAGEGDKTLVSIDIEQDGSINISSSNAAALERATKIIEGLTREVAVGEIITGTIAQIVRDRNTGKEIGAIVQITPSLDGMIHISQIAPERVEHIEDYLHVGDEITAKVLEIDRERGRISLSRKAALAEE